MTPEICGVTVGRRRYQDMTPQPGGPVDNLSTSGIFVGVG